MGDNLATKGSYAPLKIAILGGGTAGWMTAAALISQLPERDYAITLIESDAIGTVGVGEATLPHLKIFNDMLGLDEAEFMRSTGATFKLGIDFRGWDRPGSSYIHPFGAFGEPWSGIQFQHHWLRAQAAGQTPGPIADYSYAVMAARAQVFDLPNDDAASIRSTYSYAYHLDAGLYADYLRRWAIARGVSRIEGKVGEVARHPESGLLESLALESGAQVQAELFIDCSGFRSLLIGQQLGVDWVDWKHWLPCDRAWAVPCSRADAFVPYTCSTAQTAGWTWRIPLQHRIGNGYVFSSRFVDDDTARDTLLSALEAEPAGTPRLLHFATGKRECAWAGNCVAIGLASGFLEPLESTSIYLIQAAVIDLIRLIPRRPGAPDPRLRNEFNRLFDLHYERVRDFLILHYTANRREGEPLWDHVRTMPLPATLAQKIALFRARASLPDYRYGLFARDSWLAVLLGQNIVPDRYDPLAEKVPLDALDAKLADFRQRIASGVAMMPGHTDFIADYCAASAAPQSATA